MCLGCSLETVPTSLLVIIPIPFLIIPGIKMCVRKLENMLWQSYWQAAQNLWWLTYDSRGHQKLAIIHDDHSVQLRQKALLSAVSLLGVGRECLIKSYDSFKICFFFLYRKILVHVTFRANMCILKISWSDPIRQGNIHFLRTLVKFI